MQRAFISWIPLAIAITGVCLLIYATVQQNYRQSLNDPQIQMAEDAAQALSGGEVPAALVPRGVPMIDVAKSLAPFIAIYDESGMALESSGVLDGKPPVPPKGVFDLAREQETNLPHNTWQPEAGVRIASVLVHVQGGKGGFVLVGRNMREVENREGDLGSMVLVTWLALLVVTLGAQIVVVSMRTR